MKKRFRTLIAVISAAVMLVMLAVPAGAASKYYIKPLFSDVNVRSGPGYDYEIVGKAVLNTEYPCLGSSIDAGGVTWYRIRCNLPDAWISGDYSRRYLYKVSGSAEPAGEDSSGSAINAVLQETINETAEDYGVSGLQIAVIRGSDQKMFVWNYGYATKKSTPMTTNTKIRVASVTKALVGICALKMQEDGFVGLDEDIGAYWGEELPKRITLRDLLSHTSTLRYLRFAGGLAQTREQLENAANYIEGEAGSQEMWSYNNYAMGIAGTTLELAAGETLDAYARENIFDPLEISASFFSGSFGEKTRLATLYESDGGVERTLAEAKSVKGSKTPGNNTNAFAGGLTISAKDTAKLFFMLANDGKYGETRVLSEESVERIEEKQFRTQENGGEFYQCLPLRFAKNRYGAEKLYYHTGNAYGVIAMASYNPDTGDTVAVVTIGANPKRDRYGVYRICAMLTQRMYRSMEYLGQ